MTTPLAISMQAQWERSIIAPSTTDVALLISVIAQSQPLATKRSAMDVAFVIDRSGSMGGGKLEQVKQAVNAAVTVLKPGDRFTVVTFDDQIELMMPLTEATLPGQMLLASHLQHLQPRGGTNLSDGWLTGCQQLAATQTTDAERRLRRAILLTDGQANAGITDSAELARHATVLREAGITTTTMGVGYGFDEVLLGSLAEAGGGNFEYLAPGSDLNAVFRREIDGLTAIVAVSPSLSLSIPPMWRAELLNQFPNSVQGQSLSIDLRSLAAAETVNLVVVFTPHGANPNPEPMNLSATWSAPGSGQTQQFAIALPTLTVGTAAEADAAPEDSVAGNARRQEESLRWQREALRLDRAGDFHASRAMFAASRQQLEQVDDQTLTDDQREDLAAELANLHTMAQAPAAMLDEDIHKERTASAIRRSRGGPRR